MATRLYGVATTAAPITPTPDAGWQSTTGFVRRNLATTKAAATESRTNVAVASGANNETLGFQLISAPLEGAQSISGTVTIMTRGRELAAQDNIGARARGIRVVSGDGSTVRGTLLAQGFHGETTELGTTIAGYRAANAQALSTVNAQDGDRIVVEIGYGMTTTGTTPLYDMVIGGDGTDHTNAITDATGTVPWIEFSQNLTFEVPASNVAWDPGSLTLSPVAWGATPQPVSVAWTPGQLTADPVAWGATPGEVGVDWPADSVLSSANFGPNFNTPDRAEFALGTVLAIRMKIAMIDWTPGAFTTHQFGQTVLGQPNDQSWIFSIHANGHPRVAVYPDGTNGSLIGPEADVSFADVGAVNGGSFYVGALVELDIGGNQRRWTYEYSLDGDTWLPLGSGSGGGGPGEYIESGATSFHDSAQTMGSPNLVEARVAEFSWVKVWDDTARSNLIAAPDFTDLSPGATSHVDEVGNTWTHGAFTSIVDTGAVEFTIEPTAPDPAGSSAGPTRHFDGTDDIVTVSPGTLDNLGTEACTIAFLWRAHAIDNLGLIRMENAVNADVVQVNPFNDGFCYFAVGGFDQQIPYVAGQWELHVFSRAGTNPGATRWHRYRYARPQDGWTHQNGNDLTEDTTTIDHIHFGFIASGHRLNGDLAYVAVWRSVLDDGDIETLASAVYTDWLDLAPDAAWRFSEPVASPIVDDTGNGADQTAVVGTTQVDEGPPGFDPDLGGAAWTPAEFTLEPVAWAITPQPVTVAWTPGEFTIEPTAPAATPGQVTVGWTPAELVLAPVAWAATPGLVSIAWTAAQFTLEVPVWSAGPPPVFIAWTPAELVLEAAVWPLTPGLVAVGWEPPLFVVEAVEWGISTLIVPPWTNLRAVAWAVELEAVGPEPELVAVLGSNPGGLVEHTLKVGDERTLRYDLRRDLTGLVSVTFQVVAAVGSPLIINRAGNVVDLDDGIVDLDILAGDYGSGLLEMSARYPDRRPFLLAAVTAPGQTTHPNRGQEILWLEPALA